MRPDGDVPTSLRITLATSDTLKTAVRIVSSYVFRGEQFVHYPYELAYKVQELLPGKKALPYIEPQASYPAGVRGCDAPRPENVDELVLDDGMDAYRQLQRNLRYPDEARRQRIEGRVYVMVTVDEAGRVTCVAVVAGLPGGLNEAAIAALRNVQFEPARYRGQPVPIVISWPITFKLK